MKEFTSGKAFNNRSMTLWHTNAIWHKDLMTQEIWTPISKICHQGAGERYQPRPKLWSCVIIQKDKEKNLLESLPLSCCNTSCSSGCHFLLYRFNSDRKLKLQSWTQTSPSHCIKWIRRSLLSTLRELELRIAPGKLHCWNDLLHCLVLNSIFQNSGRQKRWNHHINQVNDTHNSIQGKRVQSPPGVNHTHTLFLASTLPF